MVRFFKAPKGAGEALLVGYSGEALVESLVPVVHTEVCGIFWQRD